LAIGRIGNFSYADPLHTKEYHPKGKNPGDIVTTFSYGLRIVYEKMNEVDASYQSKFKHDDYGQTLQSFAREEKIAKIRKASREVAKQLFPNNERLQQEFINWVHDHAGNPKGKNPGDVVKLKCSLEGFGMPKRSPHTSYGRGQTVESLHRNGNGVYHPRGKNPGDVLSIDFLKQLTTEEICRLYGYDPDAICPVCGRSYKRHVSRAIDRGKIKAHRIFIPCKIEGKNPGDFWSISTKPFPEAHFAVYPLSLCVRPILSSCPPDGIILDPFVGSGTTCLAAELINRKLWDELDYTPNETAKKINWNLRWIGIEINPKYVEMAKRRLKPYISQKTLIEMLEG